MKLKFAKAAAVISLAAAATFAPIAAHAYPSGDEVTISNTTIVAGGDVTFSVEQFTFGPGTTVNIILSGENASAGSLGVVKAAYEVATLGTVAATADGAVAPVAVTLPADASGSYVISATGVDADGNPISVSSAAITIAAAGGTGGSGSLPATGMDAGSLLGLWVGGGALVLAGGAVVVGAAVQRQRKQAA